MRAKIRAAPDGDAVVTTPALESREAFQTAVENTGPMTSDDHPEVKPRRVRFLPPR
jgi:hypothetical protein